MLPTNDQEQEWLYWYPRVYAYFYKRVNAKFEVEELTANTMNTAFMANNVIHFKAYIWKVAHNYLVKYINTKTTSPMVVTLDENLISSPDEPSFVFDEEAENTRSFQYEKKLKQMKECIRNQLTKDEQKIVELCIYEEKNSTEVGKILELRADNVRQKLSRTLKKLKVHCRQIWPENSSTN